MENFGEKTPVSYLQEHLVSKQMVPHYDLIHNGVGTHNPTFTYRVKVGDLWEDGTGRSKRVAKHNAAKKMLKSLNVIEPAISEEEDENEFLREVEDNFVGKLKEYCFNQNYPAPKYFVEEAGGPPHARVFKMICCVSQLKDFGISTTKKQAKQQAADKMLQRLKLLKGKTSQELVGNILKLSDDAEKFSKNTDEVIEKYNALKPSSVPISSKDPLVLYKDQHKAYSGLQNSSATLSNLINNTIVADVNNSLSLIYSVAQELEATTSTLQIPSVETDKTIFITSMTVFPPVTSAGDSEEEAALNVLQSLLFLCKD